MAKLKGKVIAGKVLIRPSEAEEKTAGGIFIPDSAKDAPLQGEVVLVGKALKDENVELVEGDVVVYGKYSSTELTIEGEKYLLLAQKDVLYIF